MYLAALTAWNSFVRCTLLRAAISASPPMDTMHYTVCGDYRVPAENRRRRRWYIDFVEHGIKSMWSGPHTPCCLAKVWHLNSDSIWLPRRGCASIVQPNSCSNPNGMGYPSQQLRQHCW